EAGPGRRRQRCAATDRRQHEHETERDAPEARPPSRIGQPSLGIHGAPLPLEWAEDSARHLMPSPPSGTGTQHPLLHAPNAPQRPKIEPSPQARFPGPVGVPATRGTEVSMAAMAPAPRSMSERVRSTVGSSP